MQILRAVGTTQTPHLIIKDKVYMIVCKPPPTAPVLIMVARHPLPKIVELVIVVVSMVVMDVLCQHQMVHFVVLMG
jgi:hypothetical protein